MRYLWVVIHLELIRTTATTGYTVSIQLQLTVIELYGVPQLTHTPVFMPYLQFRYLHITMDSDVVWPVPERLYPYD